MNKKELWYFSAEWCGPCKQFGPVMDAISKQGIPVKKLNVDYTPEVSTKFGIKNIPTVILVENEQEIRRFTGARSMKQVTDFYNG
jgi:thioredoxin 1